MLCVRPYSSHCVVILVVVSDQRSAGAAAVVVGVVSSELVSFLTETYEEFLFMGDVIEVVL